MGRTAGAGGTRRGAPRSGIDAGGRRSVSPKNSRCQRWLSTARLRCSRPHRGAASHRGPPQMGEDTEPKAPGWGEGTPQGRPSFEAANPMHTWPPQRERGQSRSALPRALQPPAEAEEGGGRERAWGRGGLRRARGGVPDGAGLVRGPEGHPGGGRAGELEDLPLTVVKWEVRVVDLIKGLRWGRGRKSGWTPSS